MTSKTCGKCGGRMAQGYLLDHTHGGYHNARWVEGPPEKSIWLGVKLRGKRQLQVQTWRCQRCALLESYAPQE